MIKIVNVSQRQGLTCGYLESIALDCLAWICLHRYKSHELPFLFFSLFLFSKVIHNLLNMFKKEWARSKEQLNVGCFYACVVRENSKFSAYLLHAARPTTAPGPHPLLPWKGFSIRIFQHREEKFHLIFIKWVGPGTCIALFCRQQ